MIQKRQVLVDDIALTLKHIAPGQVIRHQWLFLTFALRDDKPRPCKVIITFRDQWRARPQRVEIPFDLKQFGTYHGTHLPQPTSLEQIRDKIDRIAKELAVMNRRETDLHQQSSTASMKSGERSEFDDACMHGRRLRSR